MKYGNQFLRRLVWSLVLVLVAGVVWWLTKPDPRSWLVSVSSGFIVLAVAGIWISFLTEMEAGKQIKKDIDTRFSVLDTILQSKINNAYFDENLRGTSTCREEARFRQQLIHEIETCQSEIRILGVAAREFLHEGKGFAYEALKNFLERQKKNVLNQHSILSVALIHPLSEQAVSRAFREDDRFKAFADYRNTRLWSDVNQSCGTLVDWANKGLPVTARAYMVAPSCFLVFVNEKVFVEQYNFGRRRERASGKVPIFEVSKGGPFYEQLNGHFEYVWRTASNTKIDSKFLKCLKTENPEFQNFIHYVHGDLDNVAYDCEEKPNKPMETTSSY